MTLRFRLRQNISRSRWFAKIARSLSDDGNWRRLGGDDATATAIGSGPPHNGGRCDSQMASVCSETAGVLHFGRFGTCHSKSVYLR